MVIEVKPFSIELSHQNQFITMSGRRTQTMVPVQFDKIPKERSRCTAAICVSWKVFTCIFSHVMLVTLVVAYCIFGAITFEYLEARNEIEVSVTFDVEYITSLKINYIYICGLYLLVIINVDLYRCSQCKR